jgi:hypothetical protein
MRSLRRAHYVSGGCSWTKDQLPALRKDDHAVKSQVRSVTNFLGPALRRFLEDGWTEATPVHASMTAAEAFWNCSTLMAMTAVILCAMITGSGQSLGCFAADIGGGIPRRLSHFQMSEKMQFLTGC